MNGFLTQMKREFRVDFCHAMACRLCRLVGVGAGIFQRRGIQDRDPSGDLKPGHQDAIRTGQRRLDQASTHLLPSGKFNALGERLDPRSMNPDEK